MPEGEHTTGESARERALRIRAANLDLTLTAVRDDLNRLQHARMHRWPAALAQAVRRAAGRPVVTRGALDRALRRLEKLEEASAATAKASPRGPRPRPSVTLCVGGGWGESASTGGDVPFAERFAAALSRKGLESSVARYRDLAGSADADVLVHLRGRGSRLLSPGQFNVMWILSHPEEVAPPEYDGYDLVLVASLTDAGRVGALTRVPVRVLEQATDPDEYRPAARRDIPVAFVGNRRAGRPLVDAVAAAVPELQVWGEGWGASLAKGQWRGRALDRRDVADVYSRSLVVLSDHWPAMRHGGYLANRVYDALAAGAWVVSDRVAGVERQPFGGALLPCDSGEEAVAHVKRLLLERRPAPPQGADAIRREHTFAHRADALAALLAEVGSVL